MCFTFFCVLHYSLLTTAFCTLSNPDLWTPYILCFTYCWRLQILHYVLQTPVLCGVCTPDPCVCTPDYCTLCITIIFPLNTVHCILLTVEICVLHIAKLKLCALHSPDPYALCATYSLTPLYTAIVCPMCVMHCFLLYSVYYILLIPVLCVLHTPDLCVFCTPDLVLITLALKSCETQSSKGCLSFSSIFVTCRAQLIEWLPYT